MVSQLIQQHSQSAFAMALRMLQCREDAYDVIQEACCSLLKQPQLPSDSAQFRMLLFKVVRNKVIDRVRSQKLRQSDPLNEDTVADAQVGDPLQLLESEQIREKLEWALTQLSLQHRDIILLKDWQGFSYAEIGSILEIESGTVMSRLHRARMALRQLMMQGG